MLTFHILQIKVKEISCSLDHLINDAVLLGGLLLLVVGVVEELRRRLLIILPRRVADLQLHQLLQEHEGRQLRLRRVVNVLPGLDPSLLDRRG